MRTIALFVTAAMAVTCGLATAQNAQPPAFTPVRWNENYSYLRDPERRTEPFDRLKFIPLDEQGEWYLSLGGQARYRYEYWNNAAFGAGPQDDDGFHLLRLMAHADLHMGPNVRTFVQARSSFIEDREGGPRPIVDRDRLNLEQAFVDLRIPLDEDTTLTLRPGRQNLLYGAQRLISPLDWSNTRRTFDGLKASLAWHGRSFDLFWVRPVLIEDHRAINRTNHDVHFAGGYYTRPLPALFEEGNTRLEAYGLWLDREPGIFAAGVANERRATVGGRVFSSPRPWDFDVEAAYQFGSFGGRNISAWMVATEGGYTFADATFEPRVFVGLDVASGDRSPGSGSVGTFNQLFPLGHAYLGYADVIGRQNIIDLHPGVVLKLRRDVTLRADYHLFWRYSTDDALYNAGGGILRPGGAGDARFAGSEIDLFLTWQINRYLHSYVGYSRFFAGRFIRQSGPSDDIDFAYAAIQFTF